jgi:streptomycin 6-kinase
VIAPVADPALPALEVALDPERIAEVLARAVGIDAGGALQCSAEVVAYKPGQRCTIRYTLEGRDLVGKVYGRPVLAERVAGWMRAVGEPPPLAVVPELGLLVRPYVAGHDLRHALEGGPAVELCARRLTALHASPPPAGVKPKPLAHEMRKLDGWYEEIEAAAPARSLRHVRRSLHSLAERLPAERPVLIHRDFYYANVVWDGSRAWLLDFDELGVGDPAFDVGHFLAHLEVLGYRMTGRFGAYADASGRFAGSCGPVDPDRLRVWRGYTFLKLAATEVRRRREGWRELAVAFVARAGTEGDAET